MLNFRPNNLRITLVFLTVQLKRMLTYQCSGAPKENCSDKIHSCSRTFISNTARTATILNRDNTRRQCSKQYSRQCVETDQFWSLLRVNAQAGLCIFNATTAFKDKKGNFIKPHETFAIAFFYCIIYI